MKQGIRFIPILALLGVLTAGLWVPEGLFSFVPKCWFLSLFGLPCPGCGLTRSFLALAHGQLLEAIRFNAAGPLLFGIFFVSACEQTRKLWQPDYNYKLSGRVGTQISTIFVLILFGQWVIKLIHHFGLVTW